MLYQEPYIDDVSPAGFGPVAGGTVILITGGYFGAYSTLDEVTSHVQVTLDDIGKAEICDVTTACGFCKTDLPCARDPTTTAIAVKVTFTLCNVVNGSLFFRAAL